MSRNALKPFQATAQKVATDTTGATLTLTAAYNSFILYAVGADVHWRTGVGIDQTDVVDFTDSSTAADPVAFNGVPQVWRKMDIDDTVFAFKTDTGTGTIYIIPVQDAQVN